MYIIPDSVNSFDALQKLGKIVSIKSDALAFMDLFEHYLEEMKPTFGGAIFSRTNPSLNFLIHTDFGLLRAHHDVVTQQNEMYGRYTFYFTSQTNGQNAREFEIYGLIFDADKILLGGHYLDDIKAGKGFVMRNSDDCENIFTSLMSVVWLEFSNRESFEIYSRSEV